MALSAAAESYTERSPVGEWKDSREKEWAVRLDAADPAAGYRARISRSSGKGESRVWRERGSLGEV